MRFQDDFDKARIEYGDGEGLTSTMWTVGHVKGTERFIAVNGEFGNFDLRFNDGQTFWKRAIKAGEVAVDGRDADGNKIQMDFVRVMHVASVEDGKHLGSYEQYLRAVDLAHIMYREKMASAEPSADHS